MKRFSILFFIKQLTTYRKSLMLGILLSIILAFSAIGLLTLSGWFISAAAFAGLTASSAITFNYLTPAAIIRLLSITRIASRYFDRVVNHDYTFKLLTQLRVWFYQKLIPLSPGRLLLARSGDLLNRLVNDIDTLDHLYLNIISPFVVLSLTLICGSFFISHFSQKLSIVNFIVALTSVVFISFISFKKSIATGKKIQHTLSALRIKIIDTLQGFVDLLLFEKKETRENRLVEIQNTLTRYQQKYSHLKGFIISMMLLASGVSIFCIFNLGIPLVNAHKLNGAILAMIVFLIIALFEQLTIFPLATLSLGKAKESANRLLSTATQSPTVIFPTESIAPKNHDIIFSNITFAYPETHQNILNNFSANIASQEKVAITGVSGIGKSTILNLLSRIYDAQTGTISIGNKNIQLFSQSDLRKTASYVTQQIHIFNASVRDNIALFDNTLPDELIWYWLDQMNFADTIFHLPDQLNTIMGEFGKNFSGGQIRRIAIARALMANTPILLLDEPTTGLENNLIDIIWKKCEKDFEQKTIITTTHDKNLLEKMRVITLN